MKHPTEPVTDADLQSYVDEQLPMSRRIDVEAHLGRHPDAAAAVMAELRTMDELRLALADLPPSHDPRTVGAARRLQRRFSRARLLRRLRPAAAIMLFVGIGWLAHAQLGPIGVPEAGASSPPPKYVSEGVMAHRTTLVRAGMASQPEVPDYDPGEIRAATAIAVPTLPGGWEIVDVQVFPSDFGPSLELAIRSDELGSLSLFATRPGGFDVVRPSLVHERDLEAAHWQIGEVAYVLVSSAAPDRLEQAARSLSASLSNTVY